MSSWSPITGYSTEVDNHPDVTTGDIYSMLAGDFLPRDINIRRREKEIQDKTKEFRNNPQKYFEAINTRELIRILREISLSGRLYVYGAGELCVGEIESAAVRAVLSTREHIPNKPQAKAIRAAKAKANHGRSKSKDR